MFNHLDCPKGELIKVNISTVSYHYNDGVREKVWLAVSFSVKIVYSLTQETHEQINKWNDWGTVRNCFFMDLKKYLAWCIMVPSTTVG